MFKIVSVLCVAMLMGLLAAPLVADTRDLSVGGRNVVLESPDALGDAPAPVVIALHGGLGNAGQFAWSLGLNRLAREHGFRVAYVQGTRAKVSWAPFGRVWNAGTCCGPAFRQDVDDVAHLAAVANALADLNSRAKVLVVGHSNGGMMATRLACTRPDVVAQVVSIAGPLLVDRCKVQSGVSVLHIHGTADVNVPIGGSVGVSVGSQLNFPPLLPGVAILRGAGADVAILEVEGAGHFLGGINRKLRSQTGKGLAQTIGGFFGVSGG